MRRNRWAFVIVSLALTATACFSDPPSEPGLDVVSTDLKFQTIQEKGAGPPGVAPQAGAPAPPTLAPLRTLPPSFQRPDICPSAEPTEQPDEDVPTEVTRLPRAGEYLWKVAGSEQVEQIRLSFPEFDIREIRNVSGQVADERLEVTDFTFETVEDELSQSNPSAPEIVQTFHVTDSGVFLQKIVRNFPDGSSSTFEPVNEVLYLALPVVIGPDDAWTSEGIDLFSSGEPQILTHEAHVKGRTTLDVCGTRVRVWVIRSMQTFQVGSDTVTRSYDYAIATHFGGRIMFEHVQTPCQDTEGSGDADGVGDGVCDQEPALAYEAQTGRLFPEAS